MTTEELKSELEKLEHKKFMLNMSDHWSSEDYSLDRKYHERILEIKKMLGELD